MATVPPTLAERDRDGTNLPTLRTLDELEAIAERVPSLFVRYSKGFDADRSRASIDYESGLQLPGLSVNPLNPEPWWTRDVKDWLARQLCNYVHLRDNSVDDRRAWVLTGELVGRGPDNEPLVQSITPLARISKELLDEAKRRYEENFEVGRDSTGDP